MTKPKIKHTPESLMKYRAVENIRPGAWWLGEYVEDDGEHVEMWTQVNVSMSGEQIATGRKIVRAYGVCTDGTGGELAVYRGTQVRSLTAADGKRCGLEIAEPKADDDG